jgi:hypothetical protein
LNLDEIFDLEPARTQQADHVAVPEMELDGVDDALLVAPLEAVHAEVVAMELRVSGRFVIIRRVAQHHEGRARLEHEASARTQDPRGLRDPSVRVAPDRGPVHGDREVEAPVDERRMFGVCVHEREAKTKLVLKHPGRRKLPRRVVETDHLCAQAHQPRRDVGRPAAELDRVEPRNVWQQMEL